MSTVGSVDSLGSGAHACLTFSDPEERLDIVAAFVRAGIDHGQKVVCFTESLPPRELAAELVDRGAAAAASFSRGQLVMRASEDSWLAEGAFNARRMVEFLADQISLARDEGYAGLRVTADMHWATRPLAGLEQLAEFEATVNDLFVDGALTAICQYDRDSFDPVTLAIATRSHPHTVAATVYHQDPVLRICRQHLPAGIRAAGEMDYTCAEVFGQAMAEAMRLDAHPYINLRDLRFIDAAAASVIMNAAVSLPDDRSMTIACRGIVAKTLQLIGLPELPRVRIVVGHGRP